MYFNHLQLISATTSVGDRPPRNVCQELTITALPGNQFTVPPQKTKQKTSIAKQEYPQFDTKLPRDHNTQLFILFVPFILEKPSNSTATLIILNANFVDVHEI